MRWNGASYFQFEENPVETEKKTWSEFPNSEKCIVEQKVDSEERNNPKEQGCASNSYEFE